MLQDFPLPVDMLLENEGLVKWFNLAWCELKSLDKQHGELSNESQ